MTQKRTCGSRLIDSDNVSHERIGEIVSFAEQYGALVIRRIYGDWTRRTLAKWKEEAKVHSFRLVEAPCYTAGKNTTDMALVSDANGYSARRRDRLLLHSRQRRGLHDAGPAHTRGRAHGARLRRGQDAGGAGRLVPGIPLCRVAARSRAGAAAEHAGALYPPGHAPVREGIRNGCCGKRRSAALAGRNGAQKADAQVPHQALRLQDARRLSERLDPVRACQDRERGGGDGEKGRKRR